MQRQNLLRLRLLRRVPAVILLGAMGAPVWNSPRLLRVLLRDGMGIIRTNRLIIIIPVSLVVVPLLRLPVPVLILPDPRSLR